MPSWEKVREIPLSELHPFKNHPFKVKDDEGYAGDRATVCGSTVFWFRAIARPDPEADMSW